MSANDNLESTGAITIYTMPGSQYSAKVLVALDSRSIEHYCSFVDFDPRTRKLPSGGTKVPEMTVGEGEGRLIVPDSEAILHWLDDHRDTKFFPSELASDLSVRASDGILAGAVHYYNWVDPKGYARSMRESVKKQLPNFMCFFRDSIADYLATKARNDFRAKCAEEMGLEDSDLNDEGKIQKLLLEELAFFQSHLKSPPDEQPYLLPGSKPTAVDCSVYGQLQRLTGNMGDTDIPPCFPELEKENPQLGRFWEWHNVMKKKHPIQFKGKRVPKKA